MDLKEIRDIIQNNRQRYLNELMELLKIPSVSADSQYKDHVFKAAKYVKQKLDEAGIDESEIHTTKGFPIVYGEKIINKSWPTVLVYGHYDVQPADPLDLWDSPPFEPVIKDDRIYARGACDDKGQFYIHIKAFEILNKINNVPCNVKFMIEGEEEVGSDNLEEFVKSHREKLAADVVLISDTSMISLEHPSITTGLRGLSYLQVEVTGPKRDLHSGTYGGTVANPVNVLCKMIASLKDENNHITIPGFYDKVIDLTQDERAAIARAPYDENEFKNGLDVAELEGEKGYTTLERVGIRPTLDVNGIWGGYIGEGAKTVLPSKAFAKISMRLVPNQSSDEITKLFTDHFKRIAPKSVRVKVTPFHGGEPAVTSTQSKPYKAAEKAIETCWGKTAIPTRDGGSIPIVALFERELGVDSVLMGFGLDSDAIHSPNESFGIPNFLKGIETVVFFHHFLRSNSR